MPPCSRLTPEEDTSDNAYRIEVKLDVAPQNPDEPEEAPIILLNVSYPEAYPDVAPNLDLSSPANTPRHPLLDVSEDKARLLAALESSIEESLGMAMIFTLVATLKDAAETMIGERQRQQQNLKDIAASKVEEEENRKFHGAAVTRESFLAWREKFRHEAAESERKELEERETEEKKKRGRLEEKKLTGRQLWERGLVGKVDEGEEGDGDGDGDGVNGVAEGVEKVKIHG